MGKTRPLSEKQKRRLDQWADNKAQLAKLKAERERQRKLLEKKKIDEIQRNHHLSGYRRKIN